MCLDTRASLRGWGSGGPKWEEGREGAVGGCVN